MTEKSHAPLRLLLVTDGGTIPSWLFRCISTVQEAGAATVLLAPHAPHAARGEGGLLRRLLFSLYRSIDRHWFRRVPDAFAPVNLKAALPECSSVDLRHILTGPPGAEQVDVILDPFSLTSDARFTDRSTYGVWSLAFGRRGDPRTEATAGFWEVIDGTSTETRLCVRSRAFKAKRVLYCSVAPTDRRSVSRGLNHVYWKVSAALARNIQRLWEDPDAFINRLKAGAPVEDSDGALAAPSNVEMLRAWTCLVRRYASDKWMSTLYRKQWVLAYQRGTSDGPARGAFQTLSPPTDRYWADPFPVRVGNDWYIFHEELPFATGKGRIVVTLLDAAGKAVGPIPVLEQDYHMSYPFVFQWDGDWFMIPQTASRRIELYHCRRFPSQWNLERVLIPDVTASDPTLAFLHGRWWLFANVPAYGVTWHHDELQLFHADSPLGPWAPHRNNPIKSDVRSARPAGRIFERDGQFYRPAQDCSQRYGYAVSINRILSLDAETYQEVEVDRIVPNGRPNVIGVHTFNRADDITVIDCLVRSNKITAFLQRRRDMVRSLHL
jgi:hypothetical protein